MWFIVGIGLAEALSELSYEHAYYGPKVARSLIQIRRRELTKEKKMSKSYSQRLGRTTKRWILPTDEPGTNNLSGQALFSTGRFTSLDVNRPYHYHINCHQLGDGARGVQPLGQNVPDC